MVGKEGTKMGLFDKIKDNAKSVSLKTLDEAENSGSVDEKPKASDDNTPVTPHTAAARTTPEQKVHTEKHSAPSQEHPQDHATDRARVQDEPSRAPVRNGSSFDVTKKVDRPKADDKPAAAPTPAPAPVYVAAPRPAPEPKPAEVEPEEPLDAAADEVDDEDEEEVELEDAKETTSRRSGDTLASLAAQLQMTGTEPIFGTEHMNFRTKVYINRIEYMGSFGKIVIPVNKVGWIKIRVAGTGIIVETTNNKRVVMIVKPKDRIRLCDAIMRVQEINIERGKTAGVRGTRGADLERLSVSIEELEKLAKLKDKGIITEREFLAKKKQLLGV